MSREVEMEIVCLLDKEPQCRAGDCTRELCSRLSCLLLVGGRGGGRLRKVSRIGPWPGGREMAARASHACCRYTRQEVLWGVRLGETGQSQSWLLVDWQARIRLAGGCWLPFCDVGG